jgi:hypothetical protein
MNKIKILYKKLLRLGFEIISRIIGFAALVLTAAVAPVIIVLLAVLWAINPCLIFKRFDDLRPKF